MGNGRETILLKSVGEKILASWNLLDTNNLPKQASRDMFFIVALSLKIGFKFGNLIFIIFCSEKL